jgi:hypothetical protein
VFSATTGHAGGQQSHLFWEILATTGTAPVPIRKPRLDANRRAQIAQGSSASILPPRAKTFNDGGKCTRHRQL